MAYRNPSLFFSSTKFIMPSKINPSKKTKTVTGLLASRAALTATQKRGTVSAVAADAADLTSQVAVASPPS